MRMRQAGHYLIFFAAFFIILSSVQALKGRTGLYALQFGLFWAFLSTSMVFLASFFRPRRRACQVCQPSAEDARNGSKG